MSDTSIDTDEVATASGRFRTEAVPEAENAKTNVDTLSINQLSQGKWGSESGPTGFRGKYHSYLSSLKNTLTILQKELDDFSVALAKTASSFDTHEEDIVEQLRSIYTQLTSDNRLINPPRIITPTHYSDPNDIPMNAPESPAYAPQARMGLPGEIETTVPTE